MATQRVVSAPKDASMFVVLTIKDGREDDARAFLAGLNDLTKSVAFRSASTGDGLINLVGIGSRLWDRLFGTSVNKPQGLHPFIPLQGEQHEAPSTPGDLLLHVRSEAMQSAFEMVRLMINTLGDAATVEDETHSFRYFDNRDLLGFVDGTANPVVGDPAEAVVSIGDEDPEYAGGSYVIVQKYTHNLREWEAISTEEQENVIGRTKIDDIEMDDDVKPPNSHVAANTVEDENGDELEIFRLNQPFGSFGEDEFGTYFIGYARDVSITETMLEQMFLGTEEADYDRILDFSTAETGTLFFVPSADFLDGIEDMPTAGTVKNTPDTNDVPGPQQGLSATSAPATAESAPSSAIQPEPADAPAGRRRGDGSLRIGSLKP